MKLDIGGRQVEVDDSFNSLTPDRQQATVEEIARSFQMEAEAKTKMAAETTKAKEPVGMFDMSNSQSGVRQYGIDPALALGQGALSSVLDAGSSAKNFIVEHPIESYGLYKAGQYAYNKLKPSGPVAPITASGVSSTPSNAASTKVPISWSGTQPTSTMTPSYAPAGAPSMAPGAMPTAPVAPAMGAAPTAMPAAPAAAPAQTVQQMAMDKLKMLGGLSQKVAPMLQGASKAIAPLAVAHGLYYTSPEERAILQAAEDKKRAQGWKPLSERF